MSTMITKTSGVDNFDSEIPGTVEVWYRGKKAFVRHKTLEIVKNDGVPMNSDALAFAVTIADERIPRNGHIPMTLEQAKHYLKTGEKPIQSRMLRDALGRTYA